MLRQLLRNIWLSKSHMSASLAIYSVLLFIASLDYKLTFLINLVGFSFAVSLLSKLKSALLHSYLIKMSLGNAIVLHIMVASYAELLPYEIGLHVILYLISYYYYYSYSTSSIQTFDFARISYFDKRKTPQESHLLNYFKCLIFLIIASLYTTQLTFTTLCTPFMIFDWFLVIKDCSLIYVNSFSSVCTACGFFSLNLALITSILLAFSSRNIKLIK